MEIMEDGSVVYHAPDAAGLTVGPRQGAEESHCEETLLRLAALVFPRVCWIQPCTDKGIPMDKTSKLNERLTLITNLSVVVGIIFLAVELRQNTQAIQAQTRDSITEKQMIFSGWIATNRDLAEVRVRAAQGGAALDPVDQLMWGNYVNGVLRVYENSHYQRERSLFTTEEYEARVVRWRVFVSQPGVREQWVGFRDGYAPSFRAEIDRIVAEVGG